MHSDAQATFVTERLAEGLARHAIRDWRDRVERSKARLFNLTTREFSTSKGVARVSRELTRALTPLAFHSLVQEFKRKGIYQAWILPKLRDIGGIQYLAIEIDQFLVNLGGLQQGEHRLLACIHPHALARMFLRMQTTELPEVRQQLHSCLRFYPALAEACGALQLRQIVIPTLQGHFRCDVRIDASESGPPALIAKTWLVTAASARRDLAVFESIVDAAFEWNGRATESELSEMYMPLRAPETLVEALVNALRAHTWLTEPYEERPDHLTAIWEAARRQAAHSQRQLGDDTENEGGEP